jgi:hypothetical protein
MGPLAFSLRDPTRLNLMLYIISVDTEARKNKYAPCGVWTVQTACGTQQSELRAMSVRLLCELHPQRSQHVSF